jgi:hypothetical protein
VFVGAAGSPYAAFQRALKSGNVTLALAEARDMPKLNLADSLRLLVLIAEKRPELYERAAVRWAGRYLLERPGVTLAEAQVLLGALAANDPGTRGLLEDLAAGARRSA